MVVKQAKGIENPACPFAGSEQSLLKNTLAVVRCKYVIAIIAAIQNVVDCTWIFYTQTTWHNKGKISTRSESVKQELQ